MKINQYLLSLLPNFEKNRVLEDVRMTRAELQDVTEPAYDAAAPFLSKWKFKSKEVTDLFTTFDRVVKAKGNDNMFSHIHKQFPVILKNLDEVEKLIELHFGPQVAGTGLTYLKANLLHFTECTHFVARYARKLLLYTYIYETSEYQEGGVELAYSMTPADKQYIVKNFLTFCQALVAVSGNPAHVKKSLDDVPEVQVTVDNVDTLSKTLGEDKIDPFAMRFIPVFLNPIYHVRMAYAEWQNARYKQAREELALLQLRKLNLEQVAEKKPDSKTQNSINALEKRIQDQSARLAKMERDHG